MSALNIGLDKEARHIAGPGTGVEELAPTGSSTLTPARQKLQFGPGAASSPRNAPPTGAMITVVSFAGTLVSFRAM